MEKKIDDAIVQHILYFSITDADVLSTLIVKMRGAYIASEIHRNIWQKTYLYYKENNVNITFSILQQNVNNSPTLNTKQKQEYTNAIDLIKGGKHPDKHLVLKSAQTFIFNNEVNVLQEEARSKLEREEGDSITTFKNFGQKVVDISLLEGVDDKEHGFNYDENQYKDNTQNTLLSRDTIPLTIKDLDKVLCGGIDKKEVFLIGARSGEGKSAFLRHIAYTAYLRGFNVLCIYAEGNPQKVFSFYNAMASNNNVQDIMDNKISREKFIEDKQKISKQICDKYNVNKKGKLFFHFYEEMSNPNIFTSEEKVKYYNKKCDGIDIVLFDYLEQFSAKNVDSTEMRYKGKLIEWLKKLANKYNVAVVTATQLNSRAQKGWFTRNSIYGDKNTIDAADLFCTLNQEIFPIDHGDGKGIVNGSRTVIYIDKARRPDAQKKLITVENRYNNGYFSYEKQIYRKISY